MIETSASHEDQIFDWRQRGLDKSCDLLGEIAHERRSKQDKRALLTRINTAVVKSRSQGEPRRRSQIVLIINLRAFKERAGCTDKPVLVWIVHLPLMIVAEDEFVVPPVSRFPINMRPNQPPFSEKVIDRTWIKDRVGVSRVAHRVSEQTPDAQLVVRRPTHIRDPSGVAVIVIWPRILGIDTARTC